MRIETIPCMQKCSHYKDIRKLIDIYGVQKCHVDLCRIELIQNNVSYLGGTLLFSPLRILETFNFTQFTTITAIEIISLRILMLYSSSLEYYTL